MATQNGKSALVAKNCDTIMNGHVMYKLNR